VVGGVYLADTVDELSNLHAVAKVLFHLAGDTTCVLMSFENVRYHLTTRARRSSVSGSPLGKHDRTGFDHPAALPTDQSAARSATPAMPSCP